MNKSAQTTWNTLKGLDPVIVSYALDMRDEGHGPYAKYLTIHLSNFDHITDKHIVKWLRTVLSPVKQKVYLDFDFIGGSYAQHDENPDAKKEMLGSWWRYGPDLDGLNPGIQLHNERSFTNALDALNIKQIT